MEVEVFAVVTLLDGGESGLPHINTISSPLSSVLLTMYKLVEPGTQFCVF